MSMFTRPQHSYRVDSAAVRRIVNDCANPLHCIAGLIPPSSTVLDIGAGNGLLADVLACMGKTVVIDGIEPDRYAADIAQSKYRTFYRGIAQEVLPQIRRGNYDVIVCADVIEHIADPEPFLASILEASRPEAMIIASVPNGVFGSVRMMLLDGAFTYTDSGLLEKTHLRFFTFDTIRQLARDLGLHIRRIILLKRDMLRTELRPRLHLSDFFTFLRLCRDEAASVYQYVVVFSKHDCPVVTESRGYGIKRPILSFFSRIARQRRAGGRKKQP